MQFFTHPSLISRFFGIVKFNREQRLVENEETGAPTNLNFKDLCIDYDQEKLYAAKEDGTIFELGGGGGEFADLNDALYGTSENTIISPDKAVIASLGVTEYFPTGGVSSGVSPYGFGTHGITWRTNTSTTARSVFYCNSGLNNNSLMYRRGGLFGIDWNKPRFLFVRIARHEFDASPNFITGMSWGRSLSLDPSIALDQIGIGFRSVGNNLEIMSHDGVSLDTMSIDATFGNDVSHDFILYSDGLGNIRLYQDGVLVGTKTGGPTEATNVGGAVTMFTNNNGDASVNQVTFSSTRFNVT
jgi:hypothetical protein